MLMDPPTTPKKSSPMEINKNGETNNGTSPNRNMYTENCSKRKSIDPPTRTPSTNSHVSVSSCARDDDDDPCLKKKRDSLKGTTTNGNLLNRVAVLVVCVYLGYEIFSNSGSSDLTGFSASSLLGLLPLASKPKEVREFHVNQCGKSTLKAIDKVNTVEWRSNKGTCPVQTSWLDDYYMQKQFKIMEDERDSVDGEEPHFVGFSIGCNNGHNAIKKYRMGTFNSAMDQEDWRDTIAKHGSSASSDKCSDAQPAKQFGPVIFKTSPISFPEYYCIDPMVGSGHGLEMAVKELQYQQHGFQVGRAVVASEDLGMKEYCVNSNGKNECEEVQTATLDTLVKTVVTPQNQDKPIDVLTIDHTVGHDMEVLLGATETLRKAQYLEFEYNNAGAWPQHKLKKTIDMLSEDYEFTCYFMAEDNQLVRISKCWLDQYDTHTEESSHIACVKRSNFVLAIKMESMHQEFVKDSLKKKNQSPRLRK